MQKQYPLSKEEMSLYLACTLNPNRKQAYLVGWSVELPKNTDKSRIENAVAKLFARHRILSARITRNSQGNLCKYDCEESPIIEYEMSQTDVPPIEDYYDNINLDGGKLYRIVIVETPNSVTLIMIVHHIILDGNSRQVMVRDFEAAYRGDDLGEPDLFPYTFAEKELEQEKSEAFAADKEYYKNLLSGIECQPPESDLLEGEECFGHCFYNLDSIDDTGVKNKKDSSRVRTSTIFLGAVEQALALFSGKEQFAVASAMSGRTDETKNSCGMFVRTLPMVCNTDPNRTVNEYLQELDEQTTKNRKHSLYTYMDINQELKVSLPITFAYQGDMVGDKILFDGEERRMRYVLSTESDYYIQTYIWRKNNKYILEIAYRADLYSKSYIDCFAQTVEQILSEFLCKDKVIYLLFQI